MVMIMAAQGITLTREREEVVIIHGWVYYAGLHGKTTWTMIRKAL